MRLQAKPFPESAESKEALGAGALQSRGFQQRTLRVAAGVHQRDAEPRGGHLVRQGDIVRFHAADVFLPIHDELQRILSLSEELEGTVVDFSDSGMKPRIFAIVEVVTRQTMVVPIAKLHLRSAGPDTSS